jgi:hypothetical protein
MRAHPVRVSLTRGAALTAGVAILMLGAVSGAASAPPNDAVADAEQITALPATVEGTTKGAKLSEGEPTPSCTAVQGIVWYALKAPHRGALVARLVADDTLDAAIVVRHVVRTAQREITCSETDRHGRAVAAWYGYPEGSYLIGVARRTGSAAGSFELRLVAAERPPRPPGDDLPSEGVRSTIEPILDSADAWSMTMERGTSYRINLTTPADCLSLAIYPPETFSFTLGEPVRSESCAGYLVFTPGVDGGGMYSLVVRAEGGSPGKQSYRLQAAPFGPDDGAPGIKLENGQVVTGTIFGRGIDPVDLYRFGVPRENELTKADLQVKPNVGFDLLLLNEAGRRVDCACDGKGPHLLREELAPGTYYLAVRSRNRSGGKYRLQVLSTDITTTSLSVNGSRSAEAQLATPVQFTVQVTSASHGGPVEIAIDHRDPLYGWQFETVLNEELGTSGTLSVSWTPAWPGYWRAKARFVGTPYSAFSDSGYVQLHVVEPLE